MSNKIPPELVRKLGTDPFFNVGAFVHAQESESPATSIRINPKKPYPFTPDQELTKVPWCPTGYYLPERPVFTLDPHFHAGHYYVQEASSMFVAHAVTALGLDREPLLALDLCAAPGGKSTLLQASLHPDSLLVANELIKSRVAVLEDNLIRWGYPNTVVSHSDPSAFSRLPGYFDLMLVDAPCSGSGMFRKDHHAVEEWSEAAVKLCRERQQRILAGSIPCLKDGGVLMYSTCSYSEEENEQMSDWLVGEYGLEPIHVTHDPDWGITETRSPVHGAPGYRFYPHKLQGEGFFMAVFKKGTGPGGQNRSRAGDRKKLRQEKKQVSSVFLQKWIQEPDSYHNFLIGDDLYLFADHLKAELFTLQKMLYLKYAGLCIGTPVKDGLIPDHALALSIIRRTDLPVLDLDLNQALNYLRKNNLGPELGNNHPKGWILATYEGATLGWAKILQGRINNYYPKDWRIVNL